MRETRNRPDVSNRVRVPSALGTTWHVYETPSLADRVRWLDRDGADAGTPSSVGPRGAVDAEGWATGRRRAMGAILDRTRWAGDGEHRRGVLDVGDGSSVAVFAVVTESGRVYHALPVRLGELGAECPG